MLFWAEYRASEVEMDTSSEDPRALEVYRFLPLMTKMCFSMINEKYREKGFSLVDYKTFCQKLRQHSMKSRIHNLENFCELHSFFQ